MKECRLRYDIKKQSALLKHFVSDRDRFTKAKLLTTTPPVGEV